MRKCCWLDTSWEPPLDMLVGDESWVVDGGEAWDDGPVRGEGVLILSDHTVLVEGTADFHEVSITVLSSFNSASQWSGHCH